MSTPHPLMLTGWIVADLTATLEVIATVLLLAGVIGLGVTVFVWVRNWQQQLGEESSIEAQIESYRNMLNEGLIDPQEFARIEAQLQGRSHDPATGIPAGPPSSTDVRPGPPPAPPRSTDVRPGQPPPADPTP